MKVLFVSDVAYPWTKGGSELRIRRLADYLNAHGHEASVLCGRWWAGSENPPGMIGVPLARRLYAGRRSSASAISFTLSAARMLARMDTEYDIVEFNQSPFLHFVLVDAMRRSRPLRRAAIVGMLHEAWQEYWLRYSPLVGGVGYLLERRAMDSLDYVITISEFTKRRFLRWSRQPSKFGVIHPGVDSEMIAGIAPRGEPSDLVFVGRLVEDAHVENLLRAVEILDRVHGRASKTIVVGDGPMRTRLMRLAARLGVSDRVAFAGLVRAHDEVYSLMKRSKVFVLPSAPHGGWNIASMEANAAGIPVVTPLRSEIGYAGELVEDGKTGLVTADASPERLAAAINTLLEDDRLRRQMGRDSASRAREFDWSQVCQRTVAVYEALMPS
jgi:glycosyltransferase involved in cell wall biosynthesis